MGRRVRARWAGFRTRAATIAFTAVLAIAGCGGSDEPNFPPLKRGDRDPANVEIVVDASSSMGDGDRLEKARKALSTFVQDLPGDDAVGLAVYSDSFRSLVPIAAARANRDRLAAGVDSVEAKGGSRLYDAALESYGILRELAGPGRVDGVLFIAHAEDSGSDTDAAEVLKLLSAQRSSLAQVQVFTVAYDADKKVRDALAGIAKASTGQGYTSDRDGLERALRRAWSGL
jgi:Ca-activated chloride channel homolog